MLYCVKCAEIGHEELLDMYPVCSYCGSKWKKPDLSEKKLLMEAKLYGKEHDCEMTRSEYIKRKYVYSDPLYDPEKDKARQKYEDEEFEKRRKYIQSSGASINVPKCPTCSSTNVQRIGAGEKVASAGLFGLFSSKIHKSFKCNNCKYMW